jgi:hypothetical protein
MGKAAVAPVVKQGFSLVPLDEGQGTGRLTVRFAGNADMEATPVLERYLKELHEAALAGEVELVVFDLSELDFMNSSSFKCFVSWVSQVVKLEPPGQYEVRFLSNPDLQWQRRSLEALVRFAPDVVSIDHVTRPVG